MRFVYPHSFFNSRLPDELFRAEALALSEAGHQVTLIDSEKLASKLATVNAMASARSVVYRGWMLSQAEYQHLMVAIERAGGSLLTSTEQYLATHYLPNWYPILHDLTPETIVLSLNADWTAELTQLGWSGFFIKDYVKSLKTSVGAVIQSPEDIHTVVSEMKKYRGTIEGGLCIRRIEDFLPATERRYFVVAGKPYDADSTAKIPDLVWECAQRIDSQFFSIDVIERSDGRLRIVEIGDGQVSDLVGWSLPRFVEIWEAQS